PERRRDAVSAAFAGVGLQPLVLLPEDRTLAAPTVAQVVEAVEARARFLDAGAERLLERPLIASISADPGQDYFARLPMSAVIVRGDKPDLHLAALNAGAPCLILTGGCPTLSYVLDRAEEEEVPVLQTEMGTVEAVQRIEGMFGAVPFAGGVGKLGRLSELLGDVDLSGLAGTEETGA
ncbi:MAG: DRTGG domain-containing protein, partial [Dehalococcoidia bacterium]